TACLFVMLCVLCFCSFFQLTSPFSSVSITFSLHDALPICLEAHVGKLLGIDSRVMVREEVKDGADPELHTIRIVYRATVKDGPRSEEHTSELQSRENLVCRLLLEKQKKIILNKDRYFYKKI